MKKSIFLLLLFFLPVITINAQQSFTLTENINYKGSDPYSKERCMLDIRTPADPGEYPVVIWFHGGGLTGGNKYFPEELLKSDIVLVAVNYRLSPKVKVIDCIDDAAAAVAWTFKNIAGFQGNTGEIIVSGHSAGGYLAAMVGLDKSYLQKYELDADSINALFPFSGHMITHFTARQEMGMPGTQALIDKMAPLYFARPDAPPLFLMTGDRELEMLGRYEENLYMWRMMKVNGHQDTHIFEFDGHDHGAMVAPGCHVMLEYIKTLN